MEGYKHYKLSDLSKEWVESLPKTINENGCWIWGHSPSGSGGYASIMIEYIHYRLARLVVSIYYNLKYSDPKWDTRHAKGCDKMCFWIEHLKPGTPSENQKDAVIAGTHFNASKTHCSKCGSEFKIQITQSGPNKGRRSRYCPVCRVTAAWERTKKNK